MSNKFTYDVFLSHSPNDGAVVCALAERLRADGLKVWFEAWETNPDGGIPARIEEGLERSRILALCMSAQAFGSDWAQLEASTFRFRDPLNKERRFIPLRLDDAPIKESLAQFLYIKWLPADGEQEYAKLLEACQPSVKSSLLEGQSDSERFEQRVFSLGHTEPVYTIAFSPDGRRALSGSDDNTVRLWDVETGCCLHILEGHTKSVWSVEWSNDGRRALSGSHDKTMRLWDVESGRCLRAFKGHTDKLWSVAWSGDARHALSGSDDCTVRLWDVESGRCLRVLEGHTDSVWSVGLNVDGGRALSGAGDNTVRLWDLESGRCLRVLEGHTARVLSVAWSRDGRRALSSSDDNTVRLWDVESGRCLRVLEGHSARVWSVAWSADSQRALSGASDNTMRLWDVESGRCLRVFEGHSESVLSVTWRSDGHRALSGSDDRTVRLWDVESGECLRVFEGHTAKVWSAAWSRDENHVLSGSEDKAVRLWDMESGRCLRVLDGHTDRVLSVAWAGDGQRALSGSEDRTVRLWDMESGRCLRVLEGHTARVWSVASGPHGQALSGSEDKTMRLWDVESGRCLRVFEGHTDKLWTVAWSDDGRRALSGSADGTVRLWDVESGRCLRVLEGHTASVWSVGWSCDGLRALSGSADNVLRLWDVESGRSLRVLEGHTARVLSVAWSADGQLALSGSEDNTVRLWDMESGRCLRVLEGHTARVMSVGWSGTGRRAMSAASNGVIRVWDTLKAAAKVPETTRSEGGGGESDVQYTNAKVLLVGESGAGKTGLSKRLALNDWRPSDSTVGAWATQWKLPVCSGAGVEREIWLWDFGGQADQRLIHQLYMDETALAVLVFDGQKEDIFEMLGQWDRDLTRASRKEFVKLLVAGRVDAGGLRVSRSQIEAFAKERGYTRFLETSAKANLGCEELKEAILVGIQWENILWRSSPLLFKRLKEEIIRLKESGRVLMRFNELREMLQLRLTGEIRFTDDELRAVVSLLAGPGVVWELKFGSWVLLQPERINAYAQAVIQTMRTDEDERGCIAEDRVLNGDVTYLSSMARLGADEERFVLLAMHQTLVERGLCLRQHSAQGTLLVFPSYYRRERKELVGEPAVLVSYRFNGFLDEIYATLVVRLHHTDSFERDELWRYAADFKTLIGKQLGVRLTRRAEGAGELDVYFDPAIDVGEKIIFSKYIHEHLLQSGRDVVRLRHYVCPFCGTPVGNREVAMERLDQWLEQRPAATIIEAPTIICANCEKRVPLWDRMEELFASPKMKQQVRDLEEQSAIVLNNESKERALVGEVISTVALAGQICREFTVSDKGIDMEIEFNDGSNEATGQKLYLQLKSGDSYLRERKTDGAEIFKIKDERHERYWMAQRFPVLLVIRTSDGEVRWMEIRDYLIRESNNGQKRVKQILFDGERFDVMSVRHWREQSLKVRTK